MKRIEFSKEETQQLVGLIQVYFRDELDHEIGQLPAELLLDFIGAKIGVHFYNRGLYDAQAVLAAKMEDLTEAIYGLERTGD
jgi:uncharacterized protein (DUF2164 family)